MLKTLVAYILLQGCGAIRATLAPRAAQAVVITPTLERAGARDAQRAGGRDARARAGAHASRLQRLRHIRFRQRVRFRSRPR